MNKQQAITALKAGNTLTHIYFDEKESVKSNPEGTVYTTEDSVEQSAIEFWSLRTDSCWDENWEILI
jgi:hypothetical protein